MSNNQKQLKEIIKHRLDKLSAIKSSGINPFAYSYPKNINIEEIISNPDKYNDKEIKIAGRIISLRKMGKSTFLNLQDMNERIQVYLKDTNLNESVYDSIVRKLDIGDIVGVAGCVFFTKTNELSIKASGVEILSKSLRPLPNMKEKDGKTFFHLMIKNKDLERGIWI